VDSTAELGIWAEALLSLIVAGLGAFAGAFFAFRFERRMREKEVTDRNVAAGNLALMQIVNISVASRSAHSSIEKR
jgi:hypothetical protein